MKKSELLLSAEAKPIYLKSTPVTRTKFGAKLYTSVKSQKMCANVTFLTFSSNCPDVRCSARSNFDMWWRERPVSRKAVPFSIKCPKQWNVSLTYIQNL